jgi:glutathione synthase/RimK-type ligase-like ATP-grasp enzyme
MNDRHLPVISTGRCLSFMQRMGLNFGCFDFIVTPDNRYVFLECNPNGQWLWIEQETGMKISEAIARW